MEELIEEFKEEAASSPKEGLEKRVWLENQFKVGTAWFFWIAGLSVINSSVNLIIASSRYRLLSFVGLGIVYNIESRVFVILRNLPESSGFVRPIGFILALLVAGLFVLFGILGRKGHQWAIIVGILVYIFDGFLWLWELNAFAVFFHIILFFGLVRGLLAYKELNAVGGKEILIAGDETTAEKQKEELPSWSKFVIPGILFLPLLYFLISLSDFSKAEIVLLLLVTSIFIATAVLNRRQLRTFQRWGFPLLIGWQVVMLALLAYLELPDTFIGNSRMERTAEAFMSALSTGNTQEVIKSLGREQVDQATYNAIADKFSDPEIFPVSWDLIRIHDSDRLFGMVVFPNGERSHAWLSLSWSQKRRQWAVTRVEFGENFEYNSIDFPSNVSSNSDTIGGLDVFSYLPTAVELISLLCLLGTAVFINSDPLIFIETFRGRYENFWYKGVS
jgi:hypothetical protein